MESETTPAEGMATQDPLAAPNGDGHRRADRRRRRRRRRYLEFSLSVAAVLALCVFGMSVIYGAMSGGEALEEIEAPGEAAAAEDSLAAGLDDRAVLEAGLGEVQIDPDRTGASPDEQATVDNRPLLALVVDDWGYGWEAADDFLSLDAPITIAVIPHLRYSLEQARRGAQAGHQVILHLPMEPEAAFWDLGEGAVTTAMSDASIASEVLRAYDSIPYITGINNHMGSKATADRRVVGAVLSIVKEKDLFFLDSRTTPDSVVVEVARNLGVRYLVNDRFIDQVQDAEAVRARLLEAAELARRRGWAVAIGHVHAETYEGVRRALPEIEAKGVRLARLSEILERMDVGR